MSNLQQQRNDVTHIDGNLHQTKTFVLVSSSVVLMVLWLNH